MFGPTSHDNPMPSQRALVVFGARPVHRLHPLRSVAPLDSLLLAVSAARFTAVGDGRATSVR